MDRSQVALFAPPTEAWTPVSARYASLRRLLSAISWLILALIIIAPQAITLLVFEQARASCTGP